MEANEEIFVATFLIAIGIFSLILGLLIMKFASGTTKKTGILSTLVGVVFMAIWAFLTFVQESYCSSIIFWDAIVAVLGAVVGAGLAFVLFLIVIMYS